MSGPTRYSRLAGDSYGIDDGRAPLVLLHGLTYDRRMESVLPQLTVTVMRGSGPFPHLAHPTEVAKILSGRP